MSNSERIPESVVIRHVPEAGQETKAGEKVTFMLSKGREMKLVKVLIL